MSDDNTKLTISFLGDISLNDYYVDAYKKGLNPFQNLQSVLSDSDFVIANLESIAEGEEGVNLLKEPRLATTVETLEYLNTLNVQMVSLAHNHVYDHLEDGFLKTTTFLEKNKISFLGASLKKKEVQKPTILNLKNIKIGFLNFVTKDTNPNLPLDSKVFINLFNLKRAKADIKELKEKVDHVILLLHWGGRVEGGVYPDFDQPKIARQLIDAGADLIIGHHSHTLQPHEIYKGKYIYYSLGNFCIAPHKFYSKEIFLPNRMLNSAILNVRFNNRNYDTDLYFINQRNFTLYFRKEYLNYKFRLIVFHFLKSSYCLWRVYFIFFKKIRPILDFLANKNFSLNEKIHIIINRLKNGKKNDK